MTALYYAASVASLVCWIMVLIKMFQKSVLQGILGIICGIWAFIWGWMNVEANKQKQIMLIWTIAWIVGVLAGWQTGMFSAKMTVG